MSGFFRRYRTSINVSKVGGNYLLLLSTRLTVDQRRRFTDYYRGRGQASAAQYALSQAALWSSGVVKPRETTLKQYMSAVQHVLDTDQKLEILRLECEAFARQLSVWSSELTSVEELRELFLNAAEYPVSVAPIFNGVSTKLFNKEQIDNHLATYVNGEVVKVAMIVLDMSVIERFDDDLDIVRTSQTRINLCHRVSGLCVDLSKRVPSQLWHRTRALCANYVNAFGAESALLPSDGESRKNENRVEEFNVMTHNLLSSYRDVLVKSEASQVSAVAQTQEWHITCNAPFGSIPALSRSQGNITLLMCILTFTLAILMYTSWWFAVFITSICAGAATHKIGTVSVELREARSVGNRSFTR